MANKLTHKGTTIWVCSAVQNSDLTQSGYEALTWVQVGKVGNPGDWGGGSNIPTYPTLDEPVTQKQKGVGNAGDPQIEVAYQPADAGQIILRTFGDPLNANNMAIKKVLNDRPSAGTAGTTYYSRGVVSGPISPGGGSDDFVLERYTIGLNQLPIRVDPV
jgi:hypothetical protein